MDLNTLHDIRAMVIGATGELSFAENAPTAQLAGTPAFPYLDLGNIIGVDVQANNESEKTMDCYRGVRSLVANTNVLTGLSYKVKSNEATAKKMALALAGKELGNFAQIALGNVDGAALAFSAETPAVPHMWYNLKTNAGLRTRFLTNVTVQDKVEGVDFWVDRLLGRIRFKDPLNAAVTPKLTGPQIDGVTAELAMALMKPLETPIRRGYARLTMFDKNNLNKVVYDHYDFQVELAADTNPINSQDGKSSMEISLGLTVMVDRGEIAVRK